MRRKIAHITTVDLTLRFLLLRQLVGLRDAGFDVTAISAPGPWVRDVEREGIRHIPWTKATRSWDLQGDVAAFRELAEIFRRERFDLVHTHNPKPGVMGRIAGRMTRVPHVVNTVHGFYATPEDRLRRKAPVVAAEWLAARCSDLELYQSAEDLAWARRIHVARRGRSIHLGNGIDISRFNPDLARDERVQALRAELGVAPDQLVVGTVGRMVLEKGYRELFEAARIVRADFPQARFLVVGDRDTEKADAISEEMIDQARDDVIFAGWREDIPDLMATMDVFVLPSWREGLPRSAIEAAATGLPSVLTDIRGSREVAREGEEALFVPVRDPGSLAEAITRLLGDADMRARMGSAARRRAEERFDERRVVEAVVGITRTMVGSPAPNAATPAASGTGARLRTARVGDAGAMARLHRLSMPDAFLPTLGDTFLTRLYRALVRDREATVFVADDDRDVVGFVSAVSSVGGFYKRFVLQDGIAAAVVAAPRLVRPAVMRRVIETARYPSDVRDLPDAELLSIAVDPRYRDRGIGAGLVTALTRALADRDVLTYKVVVGTENHGANRFYERHAFKHAAVTAVHQGVQSNVWVMSCPS